MLCSRCSKVIHDLNTVNVACKVIYRSFTASGQTACGICITLYILLNHIVRFNRDGGKIDRSAWQNLLQHESLQANHCTVYLCSVWSFSSRRKKTILPNVLKIPCLCQTSSLKKYSGHIQKQTVTKVLFSCSESLIHKFWFISHLRLLSLIARYFTWAH